jgi:hypothetical protein
MDDAEGSNIEILHWEVYQIRDLGSKEGIVFESLDEHTQHLKRTITTIFKGCPKS